MSRHDSRRLELIAFLLAVLAMLIVLAGCGPAEGRHPGHDRPEQEVR